MKKRLIAPSVLSANFAHLSKDIAMLEKSDADYIHIDIMDGVFVPNISFGFPVCEAIYNQAKKPMDFHLMVQNPDPYLKKCVEVGAKIISVHYESCRFLHKTVSAINALGAKSGVVLNPHIPVSVIEEILPFVDLVLVMSVNPGFGGQSFIETTFNKIKKLRKLIDQTHASVLIEVDGGVNAQNANDLFNAGADMLVSGSFIFNSKNPHKAIETLKKI